ncbi:twin-arginine translocation protein TatA-E family subunit [Halorhabdus tiamatea SARL4B]|uniref:Twin-arginine translocation protein TatA n=1 Tax=Halorhabdus tiamatea SARL4B TaxID=1033806 RepID=F7PN34_9EURY|nr:twin-arginine translocase TatA/TatE family subunit [Halorhabdus tiamatea]ERJ07747.1 twin-arginine translocation protein TatA-E family subunit [Halorhabdus tiamatea SARL4B]CCQ32595.1 twin-arginine translocation protein TatA [Halorhabdus tiamatea SARL4B]
MIETTILQLGIPGGPEVLLLLLLAVLLFGANKIPKLARSSGQAIGEFQKGREQVEQELEEIQGGGSDEGTEDEFGAADTERETMTETNTEDN